MFGFPIGIFGIRFGQEIEEITNRRSIKKYAYKNDDIIARRRLQKLIKRLKEFKIELENVSDIYHQLKQTNEEILGIVNNSL